MESKHVSNTENIAEVYGSHSYYTCANDYVDWSVRICFNASDAESALAFTLPVPAKSDAYATYAYVPGFVFPVVATAKGADGKGGTFVCFARIDSSSENSGLRILVNLPSGCTWYTDGPNNNLYMAIRYHRQ